MLRPRLFDARLDLELKCNYKCPFCWAAMGSPPSPSTMSVETIAGLLPVLRRHCHHVYLSCGGEPLLHPQFISIMDLVRDNLKSTDSTLITNAWLLDRQKAEAIVNARITQVAASVHSVDPENYRRLTGLNRSDALSRIKENIENLIAVRVDKKWPRVIINAIAMKSTIHQLHSLADWVAQSSVDGLRILWIMPIETEFFRREYIKPNEEYKKLLQEIKVKLKASGKFYDHPLISSGEKVKSVLEGLKNTKRPVESFLFAAKKSFLAVVKKQCKYGGTSLFIDQTGLVCACPDGRRPLGHFSELPRVNFDKMVWKTLKGRNEISCEGCGMFTTRKIESSNSEG